MTRSAISLLTILGFVVASTKGWVPKFNPLKFTGDAFYYVCWYENLKVIPGANITQFRQCSTTVQQIMKEVGENIPKFKILLLDALSKEKLPEEYATACKKFAEDPDMKAESDMSAALKDYNVDLRFTEPYPFYGFAYCLMNQLRLRHGEFALEAVKYAKLYYYSWFANDMMRRENDFRDGHGVPPLNLISELDWAAQKWAKQMASKCTLYHSDYNSRLFTRLQPEKKEEEEKNSSDESISLEDRENFVYGEENGYGENLPTGENIASGEAIPGFSPNQNDVAYIVTNGWYDEIRNYPFPDSYRIGQKLKGNIGNFTQTIWKESKFVGYGYAFNETCGKWFVAARYLPPGNTQSNEKYKENVLPPLKWTLELQPPERPTTPKPAEPIKCWECPNQRCHDRSEKPKLVDCKDKYGENGYCFAGFSKDLLCEDRYCVRGPLPYLWDGNGCETHSYINEGDGYCKQDTICRCNTNECNGLSFEEMYAKYGRPSQRSDQCDFEESQRKRREQLLASFLKEKNQQG